MPQQPSKAPAGWTPVDEPAAPSGWTPVDEPNPGAPIPKVTTSTNPKLNIATSGENMPEYVGATGAAAAGAMGASTLASTPIVGPALRWAAKKIAPIAIPALASEGIHQAKELPVVGPIIQHIPFAEMLPWMVGGHGKKAAAEEPVNPGAPEPASPPKEVLQAGSLYRGVHPVEDPAAGLGQIPVRGQISEAMQQPQTPASPAPLQRGSIKQMMSNLETQTREGLGGTPPPRPNEPIYQRGSLSHAMQEGTSDMPQGHTPHQSSALRSSMYDSGAKEFHARMTSGDTTYVYGDVAPGEAQAFADAESKGKAYQQMKSGHPLVAKIVNGKRVAVKPVAQ